MAVDGIRRLASKKSWKMRSTHIEERHHVGANIFKTAGTSAPTLEFQPVAVPIGASANLEYHIGVSI